MIPNFTTNIRSLLTVTRYQKPFKGKHSEYVKIHRERQCEGRIAVVLHTNVLFKYNVW